ncbi:MerR family transcriptional regulator [Tissierella sp.]|uniref:MerR family transcriptional regulator n=1 Tax=Tissierella sp. TaxID=41274 RepID=UPI00285ED4B3|nr:MerR family transcriptional regulator [Tissierella sp.]MDR7857487.1 MerR family transcriptional regulator [Tissierella sp.]
MLFIKDVCRITGLNSSAIRYYDGQGLLGEVERKNNNYRVFDEKDVEKLFFIKKARSLGFELEEIKKILMLKDNGIPPCSYVSHKIQEKVSFIKAEIVRLEKEKIKLERHLQGAKKVSGCKGSICHYIEGIEDEQEAGLRKAH